MKKISKIIILLLAIGYIIMARRLHDGLWIVHYEKHFQTSSNVDSNNFSNKYAKNKIIQIDACNSSSIRQANVKVDIGFGDRQYFGYTNAKKQLVYVHANVLKIQSKNEPLIKNRYCADEAKVKGVEGPKYDEGHVIADSLGGVSNAYNITPQAANLNRHGQQAKFEKLLRTALKENKPVTDFNAIIDYNNDQMIPSHYHISFKINSHTEKYDFENK